MSRHQHGTIIQRSGKFYVRYTGADGARPIIFLAVKDADHWTRRRKKKLELSDKLEAARDRVMSAVNARLGASPDRNASSMTVGEFWEKSFVPSWTDRKLASSTVSGYQSVWDYYLEPHLAKRILCQYTTPDASRFLTSLVTERDLNSNSLAHCRALMSNLFSHAQNHGLILANPIAGVKVMAKVRGPRKGELYTLTEALAILNALKSRPDAQAVFACAFFLGLRPSEIAGLRWEDIGADRVHIRRGVVDGIVGDTKTEKSVEQLLLIEPVRTLLETWRKRCESPTKGWVFLNQRHRPLNLDSFAKHVLKPLFEASQIEWKGLYSARRGAGTALRDLSGNLIAAQQVLRHGSLKTTDDHYALPSLEQADAGLRLLENAFLKATEKPI